MENNRQGLIGFPRSVTRVALGLCWLVLPASAHATNNCPWINEATASGLLGGAATGTVTDATAGQPTVCAFVSKIEGRTHTLRIAVELASDAHARLGELAHFCGTDAANLPAIGNEALICAADDRQGGLVERVLGRVRDQVFSVTLSSTQKRDPVLNRAALRARISMAAEQVSSNLF